MQCPKYTKTAMQKKESFNWTIWERVYMRAEVNSNQFEILQTVNHRSDIKLRRIIKVNN